jgi:hypothetical protein
MESFATFGNLREKFWIFGESHAIPPALAMKPPKTASFNDFAAADASGSEKADQSRPLIVVTVRLNRRAWCNARKLDGAGLACISQLSAVPRMWDKEGSERRKEAAKIAFSIPKVSKFGESGSQVTVNE